VGSASLIFAATFSASPAFGDSVESIAGVASLGILHAPGYPTYIVAAKVFTILVPLGSLAFRVNLFSLVCASFACGAAFLICRRLQANRLSSAAGALFWATSTSMWFYAGFAKAYAFTALLLAGGLLLALSWRADGRSWRIPTLAAVGGIAAGASYQVFALAIPSILILLFAGQRRVKWKGVAVGALTGILVLVAVFAFVLVRARQGPAVNWGEGTTLARLIDLQLMEDFGFVTKSFRAAGESDTGALAQLGRLAGRVANYPRLATREFVWPLLLLAAGGALVLWRQRDKTEAMAMTLLFCTNVVGVLLLIGVGTSQGYDTVLRSGGFYMAANLAIATWAGVGADAMLALFSPTSHGLEGRAERWQAARRGKRQNVLLLGIGGLVVLLAWSIAAHMRPALHRGPSFVDDYAANVFEELPSRAVLLVWGAERYFPLGYRQIAFGERRDVDVVVINQLNRPWYREQSERELGIDIPMPEETDSRRIGAALAPQLQMTRPVYLDFAASVELRHQLGFRLEGIVAKLQEGPPVAAPSEELVQAMNSYRKSGLYSHPSRLRFPNYRFLLPYVHLHIEAGIGFAQRDDVANARDQFEKAVDIAPYNTIAKRNLENIERALRS
jgi:hypothetical protein